jgi:hypothetical protein
MECIISTATEQFYGVLVPLSVAKASTGSNPVSPTIKKGGNTMHPLELALEVVHAKTTRAMNEKADAFLRSLLGTKEGRKLRERILPGIAKAIGLNEPLG